jgi:hypothetical protein
MLSLGRKVIHLHDFWSRNGYAASQESSGKFPPFVLGADPCNALEWAESFVMARGNQSMECCAAPLISGVASMSRWTSYTEFWRQIVNIRRFLLALKLD